VSCTSSAHQRGSKSRRMEWLGCVLHESSGVGGDDVGLHGAGGGSSRGVGEVSAP
jgi:hypothetical protein